MSQPPNDGHNGSDNPSQGLGLPDIDMGGLGISVDQFLMSPMAGTSAEAGVPQQHPQLPPQPLQQVSGRRGAFREELGEDGDTTMSNTREVVSETSDSPRGRYPPDRGERDTSPLIVAPYRAPENPLPNSSDMYYDIQPGAQNVPPTKGLIPMFKPSDARHAYIKFQDRVREKAEAVRRATWARIPQPNPTEELVDGLTRKALENETVTINLADAQAFFKHFDSQQTTMTKDLFEMQERVKNAEFVAEQYPKDEWHKQYDKLKSEKEKMEEDLGRMLGGVKQTNDRLDIHIFHLEEELKTYKKDLNEQAAVVEQLKAERYALQIELGHAMAEATNFQILLNQYSGPTPQDVAGERRAWESQREELSNRNSGLEKKLQERKTAYKDKVIEQERKYLLELFDANCASANLVPRYVDKAIQNLDNLKKNVQKETGEVGQNWRAWTIKLRGDLAARIGQFDEAARLYQEATVVLDAIDFPSVDTPNLIAQVQKALQDLSRQRTKTQKGIDEAFN